MFLFDFVIAFPEISGAWTLWPQQKGPWLVGHKAHFLALACRGLGMASCTCPSAFLFLCSPTACSGAAKQLPLFWHASGLLQDPKYLLELLVLPWL